VGKIKKKRGFKKNKKPTPGKKPFLGGGPLRAKFWGKKKLALLGKPRKGVRNPQMGPKKHPWEPGNPPKFLGGPKGGKIKKNFIGAQPFPKKKKI